MTHYAEKTRRDFVLLRLMEIFVFWYPAIMSVMWMVGGIMFYLTNEKKKPIPLYETPMVSILVPCFNEAETIEKTVEELSKTRYPNYEIIAINDGSSDNTSEIILSLLPKYENLRFIDLKENNGKANALYLGLLASKGEILVGVDSDSSPEILSLVEELPPVGVFFLQDVKLAKHPHKIIEILKMSNITLLIFFIFSLLSYKRAFWYCPRSLAQRNEFHICLDIQHQTYSF